MRIAWCLAAALATACVPAVAWSAPGDGYAMSDDAALMGGAVIATGRDAASAWYNPALLAANRRTRADVSATAYGLRWLNVPRGIAENVGGRSRSTKVSGRELLVVPAAFAAATSLRKNLSIGLAFFSSHWGETSLAARSFGSNDAAGYTFFEDVRVNVIRKRYHAGPMIGWKVVRGFEIGVSLLGIYDKEARSVQSFIGADANDSPASVTRFRESDSLVRSFGGEAVLGLRGRLGRLVRAGAVLRTPGVVIVQLVEGSETALDANTNSAGVTMASRDLDTAPVRPSPALVSTWEVSTGLGVGDATWRVGLDATAAPALEPDDATIGRAGVWNVRLGARYKVASKWTVGAGVFTDRNSEARRVLGASRVNLTGGSVGVQFRSPVRLHRKERARRLAFRTTVAVRYAGGRGEAGGLAVTYPAAAPSDEPSEVRVEEVATEATMHLLTVHLGSGLVF